MQVTNIPILQTRKLRHREVKWLNVSLLSLAPEAILATTLYTAVGSQDKEGPPDSVFIQGCWNKLDRCAAGE